MDTKVCERCGNHFARTADSRNGPWSRRRFCSRSCAGKANVKPPLRRVCEQCGADYFLPRDSSRRRKQHQRFCSPRCKGLAHSARVRSEPQYTCEVCGAGYWARQPRKSCDEPACRAEINRRRVEKIAATARADFASGKRTAPSGPSPREVTLWPALRDHGWVWSLRWVDADGGVELDFAHHGRRLNVEIDGPEHRIGKHRAADARRDAHLRAEGWRILRIPNDDVDTDPQAVVARILAWAG